jgi:L,D-transpeptidase YcbB
MQKVFSLLVGIPVVVGLFSFSGCTRPEYSEYIDTVASPVQPVARKVKIHVAYYQNKVTHKTSSYYHDNGNRKTWLGQRGPAKMYKAFVNEVMESYRYGMNPDDYNIGQLEKEVEQLYENRKRTEKEISNLDIRITASFFLFTTHLLEGRIRKAGAPDFIWRKGLPKEDDVSLLLGMESATDLRKEIDKLHPRDPQYDRLRKALKEYKDFSQADTSGRISLKRKIKPGEQDELIPDIRKKLQVADLKQGDAAESLEYDDQMATAIKKFQQRHGLEDNGIVDSETVKWLNFSLKQKAELIALGLERLRWRPHINFDDDQIIVNVPEYMLRVYRNKRKDLEMKVILGSDFNATPIFYDTLKYIVFSPTWNVPNSILEEEFLPNLQQDPEYYSADFKFLKKGEEIDPAEVDWTDEDLDAKEYRVVQDPGKLNALGHVKFVMPNNFNIYLHDTPADGLFRRDERALSHGCIRLEKPVELAEYLLKENPEWDREKIGEAMSGEEPKTVRLKAPMPVNIVYRTVWVDEDNVVHFREDIYGHDLRQIAQLKRSGAFGGVSSSE